MAMGFFFFCVLFLAAFWAATVGFFCTFFSCFAPSALGIYYKRPKDKGGLGLDRKTLPDAGAFAVTGTIVMRILAGPMCDTFGARKTFTILLALGIPGMILFAAAQDGNMFTIARIIIGLSLATFVTCQVWCSQFFDRSIVGKVNATAGGWGNLGGGITLLTMPYIMEFFLAITGSNIGASWRLCIIVPIIMHLSAAAFIMTGRDLPDGSYKQLEKAGAKQVAWVLKWKRPSTLGAYDLPDISLEISSAGSVGSSFSYEERCHHYENVFSSSTLNITCRCCDGEIGQGPCDACRYAVGFHICEKSGVREHRWRRTTLFGGQLDVQRTMFNLHRRLFPTDVIKSKAQECIDAGLISERMANVMVRTIEAERGGESVANEHHFGSDVEGEDGAADGAADGGAFGGNGATRFGTLRLRQLCIETSARCPYRTDHVQSRCRRQTSQL